MKLTFFGVRGCMAAPGAAFNRFGGNTPCVAVQAQPDTLIILDAGSGLIPLGQHLQRAADRRPTRLTLLLTHTHWDHIEGFPFFAPAHVPGNQIDIYGVSDSTAMLTRALKGQFNPHFSPLQSLDNLGASIYLHAIDPQDPLTLDGVRVRALVVPHGHTQALAFRLETATGSLVYVPDVAYDGGLASAAICAFYRGATYLIHDCTYHPGDAALRSAQGYASTTSAAVAAARAEVQSLVMFHYDPDYVDDQIDELARHCRQTLDAEPGGQAVNLIAAYEGLTLTI